MVWDSTLLLTGYPGKDCVMARRSGDKWYIGGINGTSEKQSWEIDLSRLNGGDFSASVISDGEINTSFLSAEVGLKTGEKLKVEVLPYGGFVATLNIVN